MTKPHVSESGVCARAVSCCSDQFNQYALHIVVDLHQLYFREENNWRKNPTT